MLPPFEAFICATYEFISLPLPQFSQMMLVYMGLAADIAEVFEAFRESKVSYIIQRANRLMGLLS